MHHAPCTLVLSSIPPGTSPHEIKLNPIDGRELGMGWDGEGMNHPNLSIYYSQRKVQKKNAGGNLLLTQRGKGSGGME